ncbi:tumor necrosis factor receptor superfamily member 11B [Nothobranchius furzeri]|uniref:Tumor necrosis factor receptor superfamily member 11B-like n=1 Tax=Nothobranchius furzeri TaxID=105023 RepID=A0A8C6PI28_NOTFU|nr:tumor necrosis factor receptor superfamily member 11B [Nothobranchius furzeri]KAF7210744.1 tumor necrosis factor receptor superfamily member 11B-like [Nothobranchius furzeri]
MTATHHFTMDFAPFSHVFLLLSALSSLLSSLASPSTFTHRDPFTGRSLQCDRCPPGTFLSARCSTAKSTECAPCPQGSFTELWNYIGKCLRCGVCGRNQVVKKECSAKSDCQCECKQGFYYEHKSDMCVRHSECRSGYGVLTAGTPKKDTVCHICSNGTFSDISSAQDDCKQHSGCDGEGQELVLKGSTWHDNLCANREELKDGAEYLKEVIPAFFINHKMKMKRLRRIVHKLQTEDGSKQRGTLELNLPQLHLHIRNWVSSATVAQIRQLPVLLIKLGARSAGEKLQRKQNQIDTRLERGHLEGVRNVDLT